jgi:hypothetical protein
MEILEFQQNIHLATVYYNDGLQNLFRIHVDVTLADLKHQLSQLNSRLHLFQHFFYNNLAAQVAN